MERNHIAKETGFVWADLEHLAELQDQSEIDSFVVMLWEDYIVHEAVSLSPEVKKNVEAKYAIGPPFPKDIFAELLQDTLKYLLHAPLKDTIYWFSAALIYRKRSRKSLGEIPQDVFRKFSQVCDNDSIWELGNQKDEMTIHRHKNNPNPVGVYLKETCTLRCPFERALDLIKDVRHMVSFETALESIKVLEDFGENAVLFRIKFRPAVFLFQKKRDAVIFRNHRLVQEREYISLICSVDHKDAPENGKTVRTQVDFGGTRLLKKGDNEVECTMVYQLNLKNQNLERKLLETDWILPFTMGKMKSMKKILEK